MTVNGVIAEIWTTPEAGASLHPVEAAVLEPGRGLVGDRYYRRAGTFSEQLADSADWEITLIENEEIRRFNETQDADLAGGTFRRNIVTRGVRLNDLTGRRFTVGDAVLEGIRLCEPCAHLASLVRPEIVRAMAHRAGLRARIIVGATIRCGDAIRIDADAGKVDAIG